QVLLSRLPGSLTVQSRDQTVLGQSHIVGVGVGSTVVAEVVVGSVRHGTSLSIPLTCPGAGFARNWGRGLQACGGEAGRAFSEGADSLGWEGENRYVECELDPRPPRSHRGLAGSLRCRCPGHPGAQVQGRAVPPGAVHRPRL